MKEKIIEILLNDDELLKEVVRELNSYSGCLDWLDYYENDDEFFNIFFQNNIISAVRAVSYGNYNYMDEFVRINVYGNLESCCEYEMIEEMKSYIDDIVSNLIDYKDDIYISNYDLKEILENE